MPTKSRRRMVQSPPPSSSSPDISKPRRQGLRSARKTNPNPNSDQYSGTTSIGFLSLPIEIHHMIYRLLLGGHDRVCIQSLPLRNPHYARTLNYTCSIISVNRQISDEALPVLYSSQSFMFGNDFLSNATDSDVLKSFMQNVRPHLIASITSMTLTAFLHMGYDANMRYLLSGDLKYASNFRKLCQHMLKNMTGLKSVTINFGPWGNSIHALRLFSRTSTVSGLATSIPMLMKLPKLKTLEMIDDNIDGFELLLERLVSDKLVPERTIRYTVMPSLTKEARLPGHLRTHYQLSW